MASGSVILTIFIIFRHSLALLWFHVAQILTSHKTIHRSGHHQRGTSTKSRPPDPEPRAPNPKRFLFFTQILTFCGNLGRILTFRAYLRTQNFIFAIFAIQNAFPRLPCPNETLAISRFLISIRLCLRLSMWPSLCNKLYRCWRFPLQLATPTNARNVIRTKNAPRKQPKILLTGCRKHSVRTAKI